MFRPFHVTVLALAGAILLLSAAPAAAQHYGGNRHGGYYHGYSLGHYGGYYSHYGYYPGHYGYYGYYPKHHGYYAEHYGYGSYPSYYSHGLGYYGYATPLYAYSAPSISYRANYPPNTPNTDSVARLIVRVPADATIWFDGQQTAQTGSLREFVSPPLAAGRYTYEVRARWQQNGREIDQTQRVTVRPGERVIVTFPEAVPPKGN